jgi:hypothetical protein
MPLVLSANNGISSNGANWAVVPQTDGSVKFPYVPAFYAYNPAGVATTVVGFIFAFNQTRVNVGNHYSTSTFRFTAPVTGSYEFHAAALLRSQGTAGYGELAFYKNNVNVGTRGQAYCVNNDLGAGHTHNHVNMILPLVAGDFVDFRLWERIGGVDYYYGENLAYFCGRQIG